MRALLDLDAVTAEPVERASVQVGGRVRTFGLVELPNTRFRTDADHNRDHVLVRVLALTLDDEPPADDGTSAFAGNRGIGSDFVGVVVAVGSAVTSLRQGERVVPCAEWPPADSGAAAHSSRTASRELLRLPAAALLRVPPDLSDAAAAALGAPALAAFAALRRLDLKPGATVLVTEPRSAIGLAAVAAFADRGHPVCALDTGHHERLRAHGCTDTFDDEPALVRHARRVAGFDAVIDPSGRSPHLAVRVLGFGGRYFACAAGESTGDWPTTMSALVARNASIVGNTRGTRADLRAAFGSRGPVVDSVFVPGMLAAFLDRHFTDPDRFGRVVLRYGRGTDD